MSVSVSAGATVMEIARVYAHRVDVLDRAHDDAVVVPVANDLHLVLFPPQHRFLDQDLADHRRLEPRLNLVVEARAVRDHRRPGAAQSERGPYDDRHADVGKGRPRLFQRVGSAAARRLQTDGVHGASEQVAVLGLGDGVAAGADHPRAAAVEGAVIGQRHRDVQGGLSAHGGQQRVRALPFDDASDDVGNDRLHIGRVGEAGIGHDRGRVRVHQDHAITFALKRAAGLSAGIVELARLPDDDGAGAEDQDRRDVGALRQPMRVPAPHPSSR